MSENRIAFLFPAFVSEYPDDPFHHLPGFSGYFTKYLLQASTLISPELAEFDFRNNTFLDDELKTQYITYIFSCSFSSFLREKGINADYCSGYSMGIYSALYHSGVISFSGGLELIKRAFKTIRSVTHGIGFSMGTIIGLTRDDIEEFLKQTGSRVVITNQNSIHSFVLAGHREDVIRTLDLAKKEGALSAKIIPVSEPYHTPFINPQGNDYRMILTGISFRSPQIPVVSLIDRKILRNEQEAKDEVIRNLFTPMNWYLTQLFLMQEKVSVFIECGLGRTLTKNARFIEGDFSSLSPDSSAFFTDLKNLFPWL